mmetsp:Transcript_453/g.425  ORF Transcript_453/g.425 Transcript_453/m.425 type:complete len:164 (+) Transcript_453:1061-1552(+)
MECWTHQHRRSRCKTISPTTTISTTFSPTTTITPNSPTTPISATTTISTITSNSATTNSTNSTTSANGCTTTPPCDDCWRCSCPSFDVSCNAAPTITAQVLICVGWSWIDLLSNTAQVVICVGWSWIDLLSNTANHRHNDRQQFCVLSPDQSFFVTCSTIHKY